MTRWRFSIPFLLLLTLVTAVQAQSDTPLGAAEQVRRLLFDAQSKLMADESAGDLVAQAGEIYQQSLEQAINAVNPALGEEIAQHFAAAESASENIDSLAFAQSRAGIWTGLLQGGSDLVMDALERGDGAAARSWLLLREFRTSTRFSRPGANATLAVNAFIAGEQSKEDAQNAVRADLLDTYQAQLNSALADADEANQRGFAMRQAEETGLAAGYFEILASSYGDQRGDEFLTEARSAFSELSGSSVANDEFMQARLAVGGVLDGFRAAPLSEAEQVRRAGQLLRFITLVPVEYERGVRDGKVVKEIEIQEARTFREGAAAAFADLESILQQYDADATARVGELLRELDDQIDAVVEPSVVASSVTEISGLLTDVMPESWQSLNSEADTDVILSVLDQVEAAAGQKQYALAESARLEAYALLELGIEQRLRGFAPDMAVRIESLFWQGTPEQAGLAVLLATEAPLPEIKQAIVELNKAFAEAQTVLNAAKGAPAAVAGNAAVIVFREGLEAVLILASLLASLRTIEERKFRRPLVTGAALAFVATGITWWLANQLLTSLMQYGERLEAVVSLIAIGVLLVITNWFFHKVYWTGWMANFHTQKRRLIGGAAAIAISQTIGLVILGFTSIYREGFETVLFLQSLVLDAGIGIVLQGVALGLVGVAIVGAITFTLQVKLPYKKMLVVTGVMIGFVLLTMVGHTVHVMQSVGWLPITPINGLYLPYWIGQWFGLFATWQGVALQIVAAVFVIGSYFWAEHLNHKKRDQGARKTQNDPTLDMPGAH